MDNIITISGSEGSGKSTIIKYLQGKLNADRIDVGEIRREYAKSKGLTLEELNKLAIDNPESDVKIDNQTAIRARELAEKNLVIVGGRTQFHFLPESFKLYIKCDLDESAKRIWKDLQNNTNRNEGKINSLEALKKSLINRKESDLARYKKYYNLDHTDESQYDYVIDTTNITTQEAIYIVLKKIKEKLN
jgi:predicted cytidylate kinase